MSYHFCGDIENYKPENENEEMAKRGPIKRFKTFIIEEELLAEEEIIKIEEWAQEQVKEAIEYARKSPYPESEEAFSDVFID